MRQELLKIIKNQKISPDCYTLTFDCPFQIDPKPGQFVNISLNKGDQLVPRPFSILDYQEGELSVMFKVFGNGTKSLSQMSEGSLLSVMFPLGNHFEVIENSNIFLIGGGVGIPPLYYYCLSVYREIQKPLKHISFFMGAADQHGILFGQTLKELGVNFYPATMNGSIGYKGSCVDLAIEEYTRDSQVLACGPHGMLQSISEWTTENKIPAYLSMEEVMGCGFGACVGCAIHTKTFDDSTPYKLVCTDGPVFKAEEIVWN